MTFAMLLAALVLAACLCFTGYHMAVTHPRRGTADWVRLPETGRLSFTAERHPLGRRDALPILLITALYALTAFFSLGDIAAPQTMCDFAGGEQVTVEVLGEPLYISGVRSYVGLGTGGYNLEISEDGERWSTLWTRVEQDQWGRDRTGYYWAQAEGYAPSYALGQKYDRLFKWEDITPSNRQLVQYFRITGRPDRGQEVLQLGKLLFLGEDGEPLSYSCAVTEGEALPGLEAVLDPADGTVPDTLSWRSSTYFDEIYHARTALEHIQEVNPYEITHPPLGKLILGLGIRLFGMTPFGWRFMGTLLGTLMLPLLYALLIHLFGKRPVAVCGTALFAAEFMHLTQTRIATIDTYGVFFILLSYLFFYRWLTAPSLSRKNGKTNQGYLPLLLSGIAFGLGVASKWTVLYAGAGLALLYLIHFVQRLRLWPPEGGGRRWAWAVKTLLLSVLAFVVLPLVIYTLSYWPYAVARGVDLSLGNSLRGFGESVPVLLANLWGKFTGGGDFTAAAIPADSLPGIMVHNQWYMLTYHEGVHSSHPYSSSWYQWIVDGRPILYYYKDLGNGLAERFASFNNPVLSWAGLLAVLGSVARCFRRMWSKLTALGLLGAGCAALCWKVGQVENGAFDPALSPEELGSRLALLLAGLGVYLAAAAVVAWSTQGRRSGVDVFIAVGFLAQLLPWVLVSRITFAYHYFPSSLFLVLALARAFDDLMESPRARWRWPVYGLTGLAAALYLLFYPALTGLSAPTWYFGNLLRFLPSWPL